MSHRLRPGPPLRRVRGVSLIEVMVAVLILAFALIGLAALQTRALRANVGALQRSQASMMSQYLLDVLRVDRDQARAGAYGTGSNFVCLSAGLASSHALAQDSLQQWLADVKAGLGSADDTSTCVRVACQADYLCSVEIRWDDSAAGGSAEQAFRLDSRI
ncbi:type IV pilus modification protein PilV [Ramlibacter rhizophilus]|uniref:Type IV pilus modification protein PilV n=1 Tax=Ramlibacter rhizophilus TaxID=1781167 RepID=A0A4Z0C2C6_9BURK|nr:type IV pilus modification protein PilV [Ramlibacter rhizophilus]TFZ04658.1 type IV pilus modification protein PilV [Ramlibacter rhizophilus]